MSTRKTAAVKKGTGAELSRRKTSKRAGRGILVQAATVSFVAPNAIGDSGSGFTAAKGFAAGARVKVTGSPKNSREWTIVGRADGTLTVTPQEITDESAGAAITIVQAH